MYTLTDTFNDRVISRHRTLAAAAKAELKFSRAVRRHSGNTSYIPTALIDASGSDVCRYEHEEHEDWMRATERALYR